MPQFAGPTEKKNNRRERRDLQFLPPRHEDTKIYDIVIFVPLCLGVFVAKFSAVSANSAVKQTESGKGINDD
jgi:hypothetical protein